MFQQARGKDQRAGRWEKREERREKKRGKWKGTETGQSDSEAARVRSWGPRGREAAAFLCLYPGSRLKSGAGNFTVFSCSPPAFFHIRLSLARFTWAICVLLASVCHWPVLAAILLSSLNPEVPPISLQEASSCTDPVSCVHSALFPSSN